MKQATIIEIISLLFIILFLYAAISKLMDYSLFKVQIAQSPVLKAYASIVAWIIPVTESIVSLLLFIPRCRAIGLYAAFVLMLLFTGYIIAILFLSKDLPCSCGGILESLTWHEHILFNVFFILLALLGIILSRRLEKAAPKKVISFL